MNIGLAESQYPLSEQQAPLSEPQIELLSQDYIFVPDGLMDNEGDIWVREDYFDDLPNEQWEELMDVLDAYQPEQMNEGQYAQGSMGIFGWGKKGKERRAARQQRRQERHDWRRAKKEAKTGQRWASTQAGGGFMDKLGGVASKIFGGGQDKNLEFGISGGTGMPQPYAPPKNNTPYYIAGGIAGLALLYYATKPKTKKA